MKTRPNCLTYLSVFLVAVSASFPLQIMFLYGHSPFELTAIFTKLAPLNWLVMLLASVTAYLVYRASALVVVFAPALIAAVLHNNALVSEVGSDFDGSQVTLATLFFLAHMGILLSASARDVFLNPEHRWWFTPRRHNVELPALLRLTPRSLVFDAKTFDVSENGAFVLPLHPANLRQLDLGSSVQLRLKLHSSGIVDCKAEVVRITQGNGKYPAGFGVRFIDLRSQDRKRLQETLNEASA